MTRASSGSLPAGPPMSTGTWGLPTAGREVRGSLTTLIEQVLGIHLYRQPSEIILQLIKRSSFGNVCDVLHNSLTRVLSKPFYKIPDLFLVIIMELTSLSVVY